MELKHIKELMAVMQRTGTKRLVIKQKDVEVELEREDRISKILEPSVELLENNPLHQEMALHRANMVFSRNADLTTPPSPKVVEQTPINGAAEGTFVTSPMVGTCYTTPSPDEPPFVKVGDRVEKETIVCIIEAMKVMNEIRAGISGVITEILVQGGSPVEFGTKLFRIV